MGNSILRFNDSQFPQGGNKSQAEFRPAFVNAVELRWDCMMRCSASPRLGVMVAVAITKNPGPFAFRSR